MATHGYKPAALIKDDDEQVRSEAAAMMARRLARQRGKSWRRQRAITAARARWSKRR